jgi:hypothetical protein
MDRLTSILGFLVHDIHLMWGLDFGEGQNESLARPKVC